MANYTIIGGDGKQYGPITEADVRKWFEEGRLSGETQMKGESDAEFRSLSAFPEFGDLFQAAVPSVAVEDTAVRDDAAKRLKAPAIALIVTAALGIGYYLFNLIMVLSGTAAKFQQVPPDAPPWVKSFIEGSHGTMAVVLGLAIIAVDVLVIFGAVKMMRLQNYGLAMAVAIISMLPCQCCCVLGLPFGIWALVVLNKPEVKSLFR